MSNTADAATSTGRRSEIAAEIAQLVDEYFALEPRQATLDCPLAVPLFGAEEVVGAVEALLTRNITMGQRVRAFEAAFAEYLGVRHAVMVNSGSSANLLAVSVLSQHGIPDGLRPGDEVIVPAVTWSTTAAPLVQLGLVPVFVDVDLDTLNVHPEELERALSPRTRAIFAVHLLGNPADMNAIMELAQAHELFVLEDTCESLGATLSDRHVGTFGRIGTFSFFFSHHITTGEGGMLVTDEDELADVARAMRAHGWTREMAARAEVESANPEIDPRFLFVHPGYNLRPTEMQAAFGPPQLARLDAFNEARRSNVDRFLGELADLDGELRFVREQKGGRSTWFAFPVLARDPAMRAALAGHLEERRIATRPIVAGNLAIQPAFRASRHRVVGELPGATAVADRGLFIGNHPDLDEERLDHIVTAFRSFFRPGAG
jgi:dTDP-4-amino-4,6-dideoxygalactose transaminase